MILAKVLLLAVAAVSVSVATPPPGHVATPDDAKTAPKYDYGYDVNDGDGGRQGHVESRDGVHAQGSYYVQLPHSGQQVQYSADDWGYHPLVTYGSRTEGAVTSAHIAFGGEAVAALASLRKPTSSPPTAGDNSKQSPPGRLVITELHPAQSQANAPPSQDTSSLRHGTAQRLAASIALDGNLPHVDVVPGRVRYLVKSLDNEVVSDAASSDVSIHGAQALPLTQSQSDAGDALFGAKLPVVSNSIAETVTPLRPIVVAEFGDDNAVTAAPIASTTASPVYDHTSTARPNVFSSSTAIFTTARPILARPTTPSYPSSTPSFQATQDGVSGHVEVGEYGVPTPTPETVVITPRPNFGVEGEDAVGHQVAMQFVKERFKTSTIVEVQRAVPIEFEQVATHDEAEDANGIPIEYIQKVVDAAEGFGQKEVLHSGGREQQPQRVYPVYNQQVDEQDQQAEQQVEQQVLNAQLVQQFNQQQAEQQVLNHQQVEQQVLHQQQVEHQEFNDQQVQQQAFNDQANQQQAFNDQAIQQQAFNDQAVQQQAFNDQANQQQAFNDQAIQQQAFNDQAVEQQAFNDQAIQQHAFNDQQVKQQTYSYAVEQQVPTDQQAGQQLGEQVFPEQLVQLQVLQTNKPQQVLKVGEDSRQIIGLRPPGGEPLSLATSQYDQQVNAEIAKLKQSHAFLVANHQVQEIAASRPSYVPVGDAQLVQANHERNLYRNQLLQAHSANQQLRQEHATLVAQQQPDQELRLHEQFLGSNQQLLRGDQAQQQLVINAAALDAGIHEAGRLLLTTEVRGEADRLQQQATAGAARAQTTLLKAENNVATPLSAAYTAQLQANAIRRPSSAALHQQAVNTAHQNTLRFKTQAPTEKEAEAENDYNQQLVEESKQDEISTDQPRALGDVTHLRTLLRAEQAPGGGDVVGLTPPIKEAVPFQGAVPLQGAVPVQAAVHAIQLPVAIYQQPAINQAVRLQFAQPSQLFPQFYQQAVVQQPRFPHEHNKAVHRPYPVTKLQPVDRPWPYPVATPASSANKYFHYNTASAHKHVRAHPGFVARNPRFQTAAAHAYRAVPTRVGGHPKLADFQPSQPEFFKPGRGVDHQELHRFHGRTKKLNIEYGFKPPLIPSQQILDDPLPEPEPVSV